MLEQLEKDCGDLAEIITLGKHKSIDE